MQSTSKQRPIVEQVKGVRGTKGGRFVATSLVTGEFLLTGDTVVDLLLLRLNPSIPLGCLLVDTTAHPAPRYILRITILPFSHVRSSISFLIDKFTRPQRKRDRAGTQVGRPGTEDSCTSGSWSYGTSLSVSALDCRSAQRRAATSCLPESKQRGLCALISRDEASPREHTDIPQGCSIAIYKLIFEIVENTV